MCKETISIAHCAPQAPPSLSFTCGKLHLIAVERDVCENALGPCVCYFGTCGIIDKVTPSEAINFGDMPKIRCASCTSREDIVGDRRQGRDMTDSPLLDRKIMTFEAEAKEFFIYMRKQIWVDRDCPFHNVEKPMSVGAKSLTSVEPTMQETTAQTPVSPQAGDPENEVAAPAMKTEHPETEDEVVKGDFQTPTSAAANQQEEIACSSPQVEETMEHDMPKTGLENSTWANKSTSPSGTRTPTPEKHADQAAVPGTGYSNETVSAGHIEENETLRKCSSLMQDAKMFLNGM